MNVGIQPETSVGELVVEHPSLASLFERMGLDYCCGGKRSLREACEQSGLDVESVVRTLNAVLAAPHGGNDGGVDWRAASLSELCAHIEETHHRYLVETLPVLGARVETVARVHGERHPELAEVKEVFAAMSRELLSHLEKEERVLFPLIRAAEAERKALPKGALSGPIRRMEEEHQESGDALGVLRRLTGDYLPPADACGTYRAMLSGLQELEEDLHQHIHKENNILFPRALDLECGTSADAPVGQ